MDYLTYIFLLTDNDGDSQVAGPSGLGNVITNFEDDDSGDDIGGRLDIFYTKPITKTNLSYSTILQNTGTYLSLQA